MGYVSFLNNNTVEIGLFCHRIFLSSVSVILFNCNRKLSDLFVLSGYFVVFVMQKLGQNNPISTVVRISLEYYMLITNSQLYGVSYRYGIVS